jgi:hypothetical protein
VGGFLGIGGSSAKTDRKQQLAGQGMLQNVFNYSLPHAEAGAETGKQTTQAGLSGLDQAKAYWQKLLTGNRTATMQAVAPETNAARAESDATARQTSAMGTARGGGTAEAGQQRDTDLMAKVDNLLFGARPAAAGQVADIGRTEAGVGLSETGQATNLLGLGANTAEAFTGNAAGSRKTSYDINRQTQQDVIGAGLEAAAAIKKLISGGA